MDLKPTASGAIGLCPFHDDHHASFGGNAEGNYWDFWAGCGVRWGIGNRFLDEAARV